MASHLKFHIYLTELQYFNIWKGSVELNKSTMFLIKPQNVIGDFTKVKMIFLGEINNKRTALTQAGI